MKPTRSDARPSATCCTARTAKSTSLEMTRGGLCPGCEPKPISPEAEGQCRMLHTMPSCPRKCHLDRRPEPGWRRAVVEKPERGSGEACPERSRMFTKPLTPQEVSSRPKARRAVAERPPHFLCSHSHRASREASHLNRHRKMRGFLDFAAAPLRSE